MNTAADPLGAALPGFLGPGLLARAASTLVGIVGAGGLGSNCAQMLVRTGFSRLVIADHDAVEASNLNRQFYFADQVGRAKVEALGENLRRIRPGLDLRLLRLRVDRTNAAGLLAGCAVVVEAVDNAADKIMLAETLLPLGFRLVSASGLAGWGASDRIRTRSMGDRLVVVGDGASAAGPGRPPLAPCVVLAAAKQADAVLEAVFGPDPGLTGPGAEKDRGGNGERTP